MMKMNHFLFTDIIFTPVIHIIATFPKISNFDLTCINCSKHSKSLDTH